MYKLISNNHFSFGDTGSAITSGFDQQGETYEKVIVALRGIDVEVHGLAGTVVGLRFFHLIPEFTILRRVVGGIHLERAGVDGSQEIEAEFRLGGGGEGEGDNDFTQGFTEKGSDRLTDTGGIDNDATAVPDIF